ncbi:MAG: hypothetical protein KO253_04540 [Methanobrevibacter arboriphilus]|nr:hypothetical protein [Methanobrevibacter arboriphilus]
MKVNVYSDEIYIKDNYIGIGCLIIPNNKRDRLYEKLSKLRCLNKKSDEWYWNYEDCPEDCEKERHLNNNCEIHHQKLGKKASYSRKEISKRWVKLLLDNNKQNQKMIYFKILYVDLKMLDMSFFGEGMVLNNIYNRFYRTNLIGACKYFFGSKIEIENIYHDEADDKEQHDYFSWHLSHKINNLKKRIKIECDEITFLDSDHKKYFNSKNDNVMHSQFIQLIDLILGTVSQTLFDLSNDIEKEKLKSLIYPLVERIIINPENPNSSYNYKNVQDISIFPKSEIKNEKDLYGELLKKDGNFHRNIKLKKPIDFTQLSLDKWNK